MGEVRLREVQDADVDAFFDHQRDPLAVWMAAFTPEDPADEPGFRQRWARLRDNPGVVARTITEDGAVIGSIAGVDRDGDTEVTYWIDRAAWGRHVARRALAQFIPLVPDRPLRARVAADNAASLSVLRHCGFAVVSTGSAYANGRRELTDELVLELAANPA